MFEYGDLAVISEKVTYEDCNFYQKGTSFFQTMYNSVHKTTTLCSYRVDEDCMNNLVNHFFKGGK